MHYSKEKPSCSAFMAITANFGVSEIFGFSWYFRQVHPKILAYSLSSTVQVQKYWHVTKPIETLSLSLSMSHSLALFSIFQEVVSSTEMILSFRTDRSGQTVQTQIKLLLEEQPDQGLQCLLFCLYLLDSLLYENHIIQILG